jgi:hypothetical protein
MLSLELHFSGNRRSLLNAERSDVRFADRFIFGFNHLVWRSRFLVRSMAYPEISAYDNSATAASKAFDAPRFCCRYRGSENSWGMWKCFAQSR